MDKVTFHHWPDPCPWPSWLVWVFLHVPAVMRGWVMLVLLYYFLVYSQWSTGGLAVQWLHSHTVWRGILQASCMLGFYRCVCICKEIKSVVQLPVVVIVCYRRCLSLKLRLVEVYVTGCLFYWVCEWRDGTQRMLIKVFVSANLSGYILSAPQVKRNFSLSYWTVYSHLLFTSLTLPLSPSLSVTVCLFPSSPLTLTPRFAVFLCVFRPITAPTFL